MPFPTRIIAKRVDIDEIFTGTQENILQKTTVSNLMGLLNQLNQISLHANDIFKDILKTTTNTSNRIKIVRKRINNLEVKIPSTEAKLLQNAPSYFYDNPFSGKEYLRNDIADGLLFSREDCDNTINQRRETAHPPNIHNVSSLDNISIAGGNGPCIKRFTDPDFFINEWLENEKIKREEIRQQRRKDRQNRKKERVKRKQTKKIKKLKRKRYDAFGDVIADDNVTEIAVDQSQYQLTDDTNRNFDTLLTKKKAAKKKGKKKQQMAMEEKEQKQQVIISNGGPPPNPLMIEEKESKNEYKAHAPNPIMNGMNGPPPNPLMLTASPSTSERSQAKLRGLAADTSIQSDRLMSAQIPDNAPSPPEIYAMNYQNRDLDNEQLNLSSASNIITTSPKQVIPVAPKLGFLADINAFNQKGKLKRTEVNVNRHKPKDKRTNLLDQLKNNKVKLSSVNLRKVAPKKEEKKNLIFAAMADRRRHMEDSSDDDESDWGSESD